MPTAPLPTAPVTAIPPAWPRPDYAGNGIVNLMATLIGACGGQSNYPPMAQLSVERLRPRRCLALMVIDGLGYEFLSRHPDSFLFHHLHSRLSSVFPSTTASAITTYGTGLAPREHGLTGWFTYLRALDSVATILPFRPRQGGSGYRELGLDAAEVFNFGSIFGRIRRRGHVISAAQLIDSDFSRAINGSAQKHGYRDLDDFFALSARVIRGVQEPSYVYAYWPELDSLSHRFGANSAPVETHFRALDNGVARLSEQLRGSDVTLLICADHGLTDTAPSATVWLQDHPRLADTLRLPLCGEPRVAYCYVRPGREEEFQAYMHQHLADRCVAVPAAQLAESGYFGVGPEHPEFGSRIGDFAVLMRDNYVIRDRVAGERPFEQIGVHGGLTAAELYVPLVLYEPD